MDKQTTLAQIIKNNPDKSFLTADGLDEAVIGVTQDGIPRLIYSKALCVKVLMDRDGMEEEEAMEFLDFNTYGSYMGEQTPIFTDEFDDVIFEN